jgi:hypothetical protein
MSDGQIIWIILAILVVGYFIVKAINRSTLINATIAQQQYLNSPEYKKQAQASMAYWKYITDVSDYRIWIADTKLSLLDPPEQLHASIYSKTGKSQEQKVLTDKRAIVQELKAKLQDHERMLNELKNEYEKGKAEYSGYSPENLETMKLKYELDVPFQGDFDEKTGRGYLNTEGTSSWSMYEDNQNKLKRLQTKLHSREKGIDITKFDLRDAIKIVKEVNKVSISLLQRRLDLGYNETLRLLDEMEKLGIVGPDKGLGSREVLESSQHLAGRPLSKSSK